MLYVTTSNGVLRVHSGSGLCERILHGRARGLFRRASLGFFGIAAHEPSGKILVASRQRLGTRKNGKPATDCILFAIDPRSLDVSVAGTVGDVHDVHQIACWRDLVFLTDTGKNRVIGHDLSAASTKLVLNIGDERQDVNHVNALLVHDGALWIGLNNRGETDAEILRVPLDEGLPDGEVSAYSIGEVSRVSGLRHSHDLVPFGDVFLTCASHEGRVHRADTGDAVFEAEKWTRGLAVAPDALWVGSSEIAERSKRHAKRRDGWALRYSHEFELLERVRLEGAGQVNDMLWCPS